MSAVGPAAWQSRWPSTYVAVTWASMLYPNWSTTRASSSGVRTGGSRSPRDSRSQSATRSSTSCASFSVLTHLLHEQSYAYLAEARRVLKPGGRIVFSFLEFAIPSHWAVFEGNVAAIGGSQPLNMFVGRDAIDAWASHLEMAIIAIHGGDTPHTPLHEPVTLDDGTVMSELGHLGQSVCVLEKPVTGVTRTGANVASGLSQEGRAPSQPECG